MTVYNRKGQVYAFLLSVIFIIVGLIAFIAVMPAAIPFIQTFQSGSDGTSLDKWLIASIPVLTVIGIIWRGVILQ